MEKICIFGGTGTFGDAFLSHYLSTHKIVNFSRDEYKQWKTKNKFTNPNLEQTLGDIRDYSTVENFLNKENPEYIVIASALKQIDRCEQHPGESIKTNILGVENILLAIEKNILSLTSLRSVVFISTDKACNPISIYGMCKSIAERLVVGASVRIPSVRFNVIRYGNVLYSRGSIIPFIKKQIKEGKLLTLTSSLSTRFVIEVDDCITLFDYALHYEGSGNTIIPILPSMKIKDLFEIFSEKYNKEVREVGMRCDEKIHECLVSDIESFRCVKVRNGEKEYYVILPPSTKPLNLESFEYTSDQGLLSKEELYSSIEKYF